MLKFADIGNITTNELDRLFDLLIDLKHQQHFGGFWNSVPESVDFMRTGRVNIESMFFTCGIISQWSKRSRYVRSTKRRIPRLAWRDVFVVALPRPKERHGL